MGILLSAGVHLAAVAAASVCIIWFGLVSYHGVCLFVCLGDLASITATSVCNI